MEGAATDSLSPYVTAVTAVNARNVVPIDSVMQRRPVMAATWAARRRGRGRRAGAAQWQYVPPPMQSTRASLPRCKTLGAGVALVPTMARRPPPRRSDRCCRGDDSIGRLHRLEV